jgi:glycosyltransferase involved in cell wall biosynthesis
MTNPMISIVCPFYNEEGVVDLFMREISVILNDMEVPYEIVCVDDGSIDRTIEELLQAKKHYANLRIIKLSRNFGKECALTAGLDYAKGDVIIPIDADLQDPPELIKSFFARWQEGYDVVLGKRVDRSSDSIPKKLSAQYFYKCHNMISRPKIPENVGDFRLISRKVLRALQQLPENQRFMKGIFAWVGFNTAIVEYKRQPRKAGKTNFNGWNLWNFALDGLTSFSTVPLRVWLYIGMTLSFLSLIYGSFIFFRTLICGVDLPGYASLFTAVLFLGGIQLIGIGVLGEYIGRMYMETKRRPSYIVDIEY